MQNSVSKQNCEALSLEGVKNEMGKASPTGSILTLVGLWAGS